MKTRSIDLLVALMTFVCVYGMRAAPAADEPAEDQVFRVARLAYVEGPVLVLGEQDEEWTDAEVNRPLLAGDKLYAGADARAELQFEDQVTVRLAADTYLELAAMDDEAVQLMVPAGDALVVALPAAYARPAFTIEAPGFRTQVDGHAKFRVRAQEDGGGTIQVRRGRVQVSAPDHKVVALEREQALAVPAEPDGEWLSYAATPGDEFELWSDRRDAAAASARSSGDYVSQQVAGLEDLDRYGEWVVAEDYGRVWRPHVTVVDWSPYHDGHWVWHVNVGWSWVAYEPWGWVPYHYGRWVRTSHYNWCWVPTDVVPVARYRPVWSPALVAFGYADHGWYFGLNTGIGYRNTACVGWFPLGPADPRPHRWYHRTPDFPRGDHHDGRYAPPRAYQNQHVPHAMTVIARHDFGRRDAHRDRATFEPDSQRRVSFGHAAVARLPERERRPHDALAEAQVRSPRERLQTARETSRRLAPRPDTTSQMSRRSNRSPLEPSISWQRPQRPDSIRATREGTPTTRPDTSRRDQTEATVHSGGGEGRPQHPDTGNRSRLGTTAQPPRTDADRQVSRRGPDEDRGPRTPARAQREPSGGSTRVADAAPEQRVTSRHSQLADMVERFRNRPGTSSRSTSPATPRRSQETRQPDRPRAATGGATPSTTSSRSYPERARLTQTPTARAKHESSRPTPPTTAPRATKDTDRGVESRRSSLADMLNRLRSRQRLTVSRAPSSNGGSASSPRPASPAPVRQTTPSARAPVSRERAPSSIAVPSARRVERPQSSSPSPQPTSRAPAPRTPFPRSYSSSRAPSPSPRPSSPAPAPRTETRVRAPAPSAPRTPAPRSYSSSRGRQSSQPKAAPRAPASTSKGGFGFRAPQAPAVPSPGFSRQRHH